MRKRIWLALALAFASTGVWADWTLFITMNDPAVRVYVDAGTIRRNGVRVKLWVLHDFQTPQTPLARAFLSMRSQIEFDCKEEQTRNLYVSAHTGNMAVGDIVSTSTNAADWVPIAPGTVTAAMSQIVCSAK